MSPEEFKTLVAAGMSTDQIALVMEMLDKRDRALSEHVEQSRAKARDRVQKWREKQKSEDVTLQNITVTQSYGSCVGDAPVDVKQITTDKPNSKNQDIGAAKPLSDLEAFKAELAPILDHDRIDGICAVRRKKKAPFNGNTGRLLSKALLSCPSATEAADEMILRNWTSVKPEWLEASKRSSQAAQPPPRKSAFQQHQDDVQRELDKALGRKPNDEFTGNSFDLEPRDWRSH